MLAFQMAQDVLQPVLDPPEIAGAVIGGSLQAFQQIRHALFEMGESRRAVVADRHPVETVGQGTQRALDLLGALAWLRPLAVFQRRGQRRDALFEDRERIAVALGAGKLIDLGRQHAQIVAEPDQRVVGGNIGDDGAQRCDGVFELPQRRGIVVGAQNQVELGAEIADRLVIARQLLRRRQRAQHFADFSERPLDTGQRLLVDAALSVIVDAARQRADFVLDRFDRAARHRFGDGVTNFRQFAAERGDRLFNAVGALQRFDLARDLQQMALERGEIRARRRCRRHWHRRRHRHRRCDRRRGARRHRPRCCVQFVLARSDFRDRKVERARAQRRGGAIDLRGGALDHLGLALPVLKLGLSGRRGVGNLRQPRVEARDRVVQLPGDTLFAARRRVVARPGLRDLFDLAGDRIKPLVNIGDVARFLARRHRPLIGHPLICHGTEVRRG